MHNAPGTSPSRDKLLFTPGPLTVSLAVKQAMLHDAGSWHSDFNALVAEQRTRLLALVGVTRQDGWEVIPMQGSGTFGVESVFQSCVPPNGRVVVLSNGAYGERIVQMLRHARIDHVVLRTPGGHTLRRRRFGEVPCRRFRCDARRRRSLRNDDRHHQPHRSHRPRVAKHFGKTYIVDAMSSFIALPIDIAACGIDFLISSSSKCIECVPGIALVFCRRDVLLASEGWARSLSLDLLSQLKGFEKDGKFRYTPPTHVVLALDQALRELELEGGLAARRERYRRNHEILITGMKRLGFRPYLNPAVQSPIITSFLYPEGGLFQLRPAFYTGAKLRRGFIIYPGKLTTKSIPSESQTSAAFSPPTWNNSSSPSNPS